MIHTAIRKASRIALFTHMNPDGDALGSTLGMAGFLTDLGKEVVICYPSQPSESLHFMIPDALAGNILIWNADKSAEIADRLEACDLFIGLDFNCVDRTDGFAQILRTADREKILIDHHVGPDTETFRTVYSKTDVSSACELLYSILMQDEAVGGDASRLSRITREALLTGMTTDTNNFANSVYPTTLVMASELLAAGTDRDSIIANLFFSYPLRRIQAEGYLLDNCLKITADGVAYMIIDRNIQNRFNLQEGDTEGFVNIPLSIKDVRLSILLKEEMQGSKIRVSLRSKEGTSARECALRYFHGGGHERASGGRLMKGEDVGSMEDVAAYVEEVTHNFLNF